MRYSFKPLVDGFFGIGHFFRKGLRFRGRPLEQIIHLALQGLHSRVHRCSDLARAVGSARYVVVGRRRTMIHAIRRGFTGWGSTLYRGGTRRRVSTRGGASWCRGFARWGRTRRRGRTRGCASRCRGGTRRRGSTRGGWGVYRGRVNSIRRGGARRGDSRYQGSIRCRGRTRSCLTRSRLSILCRCSPIRSRCLTRSRLSTLCSFRLTRTCFRCSRSRLSRTRFRGVFRGRTLVYAAGGYSGWCSHARRGHFARAIRNTTLVRGRRNRFWLTATCCVRTCGHCTRTRRPRSTCTGGHSTTIDLTGSPCTSSSRRCTTGSRRSGEFHRTTEQFTAGQAG